MCFSARRHPQLLTEKQIHFHVNKLIYFLHGVKNNHLPSAVENFIHNVWFDSEMAGEVLLSCFYAWENEVQKHV